MPIKSFSTSPAPQENWRGNLLKVIFMLCCVGQLLLTVFFRRPQVVNDSFSLALARSPHAALNKNDPKTTFQA